MRTIAFLAALMLALPNTADARDASRNWTVTQFDKVRLDGGVVVELETDVAPYARAQGSSAGLDRLDIRVNGTTLVIAVRKSTWSNYPGDGDGPVVVRIGTREVSRIWVNGSGRLAAGRMEGGDVALSLQGSGSLDIDEIMADRLTLGMAGQGRMRVGGRVEEADIVVRGVSALEAGALLSENLKLGVDGPSIVRAFASETAKVKMIGPGEAYLDGRPDCDSDLSGAALLVGCRGASAFGR